MRFASGVSRLPDTGRAVDDVLDLLLTSLDESPDLVLIFATADHAADAGRLAAAAAGAAPEGASLGCLAGGVIAGAEEVEEGPAVAGWAGVLPGATLLVRHLEAVRSGDGIAITGHRPLDDSAGMILLADPFTFPVAPFVDRLAQTESTLVAGGLAAGSGGAGDAALIADGSVFDHGAVAVQLGGSVRFRAEVSQGCRSLGEPVVVTRSDGRRLLELAGEPALAHLRSLVTGMPEHDRDLVQRGLQIGIVADEYRMDYDQSNFLIRAITGLDPERGSIEVGDAVTVGRTVQFQVRDPDSADADLRRVLETGPATGGMLLFTCNGRGRGFFGEADHDARLVDELRSPPALAGFFAAGEIGPVGSGNYVHGYTASLVEIVPTGD